MKYIIIIFLTALISISKPNVAKANDSFIFQLTYMVQTFLNNFGYDSGEPDGVFGPATQSALNDFSTDHGIEPSIIGFYEYALKKNMAQRIPIIDEDILDNIHENVAASLLNPNSAQFRNIFKIEGKGLLDSDQIFFCGEVNGHNVYGGYAGFKWFLGNYYNNNFFILDIESYDNHFSELTCNMTFSN